MTSHPRSKARRRRQQLKRKYARFREDAQLAGVIETVPEGAVRDERVDPARQGGQQFPELVRQALREGWATPDSAKPKVVAELLAAFFEEGQDPMLRVRLARLLLLLDQTQWERDHPEKAGKAKGGGGAVAVSVQANIEAAAVVRGMIERGELGRIEEVRGPDQSSAPEGGSAVAGTKEPLGGSLNEAEARGSARR
jgi:hypothetical protein